MNEEKKERAINENVFRTLNIHNVQEWNGWKQKENVIKSLQMNA